MYDFGKFPGFFFSGLFLQRQELGSIHGILESSSRRDKVLKPLCGSTLQVNHKIIESGEQN